MSKATFIFILVATLLFVTGEKAIHHLFSRDTPYQLGYAYVSQINLNEIVLLTFFLFSLTPRNYSVLDTKLLNHLTPVTCYFLNAVPYDICSADPFLCLSVLG